MKLRAVIVDDEPLARRRLADLLADTGDVELIAECADGPTAVDTITELNPDVVFLDVQMPEMSGFEVLDAVGIESIPALVFVTAFDDYALRAFDARAIDYLLKPFTAARFTETMLRLRHRTTPDDATNKRRARDLLAAMLPAPPERRIAARDGTRIVFVLVREIQWIEGAGNYVRLHADGREYMLRSTLKHAAARLYDAGFRRVSHSTIVNMDRVRSAERTAAGDFRLFLQDGTTLDSTRSYAAVLTTFL